MVLPSSGGCSLKLKIIKNNNKDKNYKLSNGRAFYFALVLSA